jgi:lipopolysaccharide/colanic/teichoic acid biosynthesis glycosyltransferase
MEVFILPGLDYSLAHNVEVLQVGSEPTLALQIPSLRLHQRLTKRTVDVVVSAVALVALSPVLLAVAAVIRVAGKQHPLYRQTRIGAEGKPFRMVKFQTMVDGADRMQESLRPYNETGTAVLFKMRDDPRVTRLGRFLRRFSLDELPQLWNVLKGEMSLVGPRPLPECDYHAAGYEPFLSRRLNVRPGMTGLWQVSGRSDLPFVDFVRLDLTYVQNWSLLFDAYIVLRTIPAIIRHNGAV